MGYRNKTYVIFDGDEDMGSYALMKGWKALENIDFNFHDAHDLKPLLWANDEDYIKRRLSERMANAKQVIVLVGEKTKNLYQFVRWEIDQAIKQDLPIIVVNLNNKRKIDENLCPPILKGKNAIHIAFRMRMIKHALDDFPDFYNSELDKTKSTNWHYKDFVYENLGL